MLRQINDDPVVGRWRQNPTNGQQNFLGSARLPDICPGIGAHDLGIPRPYRRATSNNFSSSPSLVRLSVPTMPKPFAGSSYTAAKALIDALAKYSAKTVKGLCIRSGSILGLSEFMPEIRGQAWVRPHQR